MRLTLLTALTAILLVPHAKAEPPPPAAAATEVPAPGAVPEPSAGAAEAPGDDAAERAAFEALLSYQQGDVTVGDKLATLHLGNDFRFIGPDHAEKVLVAWGNPPGSKPLGMIFRQGTSATTEDSWAVIVSYSEDGHIDDEDAADMDYDELLADMKTDTNEANAERKQAGFGEVKLVGWAEPPRYDSKSKKLFWAKELDFGSDHHTLNYSIRALGRKGVLELNAVASMSQLGLVKNEMPKVLKAVEFTPGMRYADFNPDLDTVAAYGLGALVAGKLVAKVGMFKLLLAGLLASKKLVIAGLAGLAMFAKKAFSKKSEDA